jgi:hypothetical protein
MSGYRAVFDAKGLLAEFEGGECVYLRAGYEEPNRSETCSMPMVIRDLEPYKNMVDGRMITSRSEHRELLKRHNLFEVGNETKALMNMKPPPSKNTRREKLTRIVNETIPSDKVANKLLKSIRKG